MFVLAILLVWAALLDLPILLVLLVLLVWAALLDLPILLVLAALLFCRIRSALSYGTN